MPAGTRATCHLSEPSTAAGSATPQCAVIGCPGQTGPRFRRGVVADSKNEVELRCAGLLEFIPALRAQTLCRHVRVLQQFERDRVHFALRRAAGAVADEAPATPVTDEHFGQNARAELPVQRKRTLYGRSVTARLHSRKLPHHERRTRRADARKFASGTYGGGSGIPRCTLVAMLREERFRRGGENTAFQCPVRARDPQRALAAPRPPPSRACRAQLPASAAVQRCRRARADQPRRLSRRSREEKCLAVSCRQIFRWQLRGSKKLHCCA